MTVEKPKPKQLLRPITTGAGSAKNQSQFLATTYTCNSLEAREKSRVHGAIGFGFGFDSHWLKNWRESFKPITKLSNRNHVITFDSHLKTALCLSVLMSSAAENLYKHSKIFMMLHATFKQISYLWRVFIEVRHLEILRFHGSTVQVDIETSKPLSNGGQHWPTMACYRFVQQC